ncbi:MAG: hemerythrin domain-containing protein [Planctomycetota bacterium]|jgi:DUF438 domain-containing protein
MAKIQKDNPVDQLTNLMLRINQGDDPQVLAKEANNVIANLEPNDLNSAQNRLMDYGLSQKLVHQLSATFLLMGLFEIQKADPRHNVSADHILFQVMTEHDLLRCYAADLEAIVAAIKDVDELTDVSSEYRRLCHVAQHFNAASEHFDREWDVIFPTLAQHGFMPLCKELEELHTDMEMAIKALINMSLNFKTYKLGDFKSQLEDVAQYLIAALHQLLSKEDQKLYETALEKVDEKVWTRMKAVCDEIGYCGIHA